MTVGDKTDTTNTDKAKDQIAAVREVTGHVDDEEIRAALERTRDPVSGEYNLARAVDSLLSSPTGSNMAPLPGPAVVMSPAQPVTAQQPTKPKVVDLTEENKPEDDLQRAIALSLQDGGVTTSHRESVQTSAVVSGVSQEDQDVSKALEASLLESSGGRRKKEPQNPHDRERDGEWPVGLKNVGQTCWFSAVIQSLFHLPAFRVLVLNFTPPQHAPKTDKERKILEFMSELRKLFALLLGSQRKYVDPSQAVGILRGSLGGESGGNANSTGYDNNQQDVSEFTHKLLDWLEEAFKVTKDISDKTESSVLGESKGMENNVKCEEEPMESESEKTDPEKESDSKIQDSSSDHCDKKNPMYSLFYGQVRIEGRNLGVDFSRTEQFGQWPLQVNGYKDIHESLEASTASENIDSGTGVERGNQERWFTNLPPVLFLELSRFHFNTNRGVAEKINNVLDFPEVMYLDRYLEENKERTREKREQVRKLKERRDKLNKELDGYLQYDAGQDSEKYPLVGILRLALEFARSGTAVSPDVELEETTAMQVDSPCPSPASLTPANSVSNLANPDLTVLPDGSVSIPIVRQEKETTDMEVEDKVVENKGPTPKHVSELELKVLSSCLTRWGKEVEEQISSLNSTLRDIEGAIRVMYDEPELKQRGYRLHAVMVHEGDVNHGHYWAYVFHPTRKCWLKFNDNTVSQTTWEDLRKEAIGGRCSTSAYSCVYIDVSRPDLINIPGDCQTNTLVSDLEQFLMEDNKSFAQEILRWDEEQIRKEKEGTEENPPPPVLIGDDPECQIIEQAPDLATSHALLAKESSIETLAAVANIPVEKKRAEGKSNINYVINKIYQSVKQSVHQCRSEGFGERCDPRLESFMHYLVANDETVDVYRRALLEQVALQELDNEGEIGREVGRMARDSIKSNPTDKVVEEIGVWHKAYHQFRISVNYFVLGVEKYTENMYEEALELLTVSYIVNEKIAEDPPYPKNPMKVMLKRGLVKHFHLAVEALNTRLVDQFETGDDPGLVANKVTSVLVPAIHILQARTNRAPAGKDSTLLEEVRGRWCAIIEQPLPDRKRDYWGTIFNTVVADDNSVVTKPPPNLRYPKLSDDLKLGIRYKAAMQRIMRETEK